MRGLRRVVCVTLLAGLLALPLMGAGAWVAGRAGPVLGPVVRLSGPQAVGQDGHPTTVWNAAANEYLVVWIDSREWDEEWGPVPWGRLRGQRVGADGSRIGTNFFPVGRRGSDQSLPALAYNSSSGEYLVIWVDHPDGRLGIFGRRLSASGVPLGRAFRISSIGHLNGAPAVAYSPDADEYLVAWMDDKPADIGLAVYGCRIGGAGVREGGRFRISGLNAVPIVLDFYFSDPVAVAYGGGQHRYLVTWQDGRRGWNIFGSWVEAGGTRWGSNFRISRTPHEWRAFSPAMAYGPAAGEFLVTWSDGRRHGSGPEHYSDIYGRRVAESGLPVGADFHIGGTATSYGAYSPEVAWNAPTGEYLVVFDDWKFDGDDIYARRVGADGQRLGEPFRLTGLYTPGNESRPALALNSTANQYLVVWVDDRTFATRGYDIRSRTVAG